MSRKVPPLTATQIKSAKPKEKEYNLADGDGLFLRIKPSGSKRWIFNYSRPFTKKRANIGFGSYPTVSLAEARSKRQSAQELLAQSIDPKAHKDEQEQLKKDALESTFGAMADKWHQLKRQQVKIETAEKAFRSLEKHVLPSLKNVPLEAIKPKTVIKLLEPVKANGNLETVKRLCRSINEVMR